MSQSVQVQVFPLRGSLEHQDSLSLPTLINNPTVSVVMAEVESHHTAEEANSEEEGVADHSCNLPTCTTCGQKARSIDRFTGDRKEVLKWTKREKDEDGSCSSFLSCSLRFIYWPWLETVGAITSDMN